MQYYYMFITLTIIRTFLLMCAQGVSQILSKPSIRYWSTRFQYKEILPVSLLCGVYAKLMHVMYTDASFCAHKSHPFCILTRNIPSEDVFHAISVKKCMLARFSSKSSLFSAHSPQFFHSSLGVGGFFYINFLS